jgi:hypothetical protein
MVDPQAGRQLSGQNKDQGQVGTQNQRRDAESEIPSAPGAQTRRMHEPVVPPGERGSTLTGVAGTTSGGHIRRVRADSIGSKTVGVPTGSGASGANSSSETPGLTGNTTTAGGDTP